MTMFKGLYTKAAAAKMLGVSAQAVQERVRARKLATVTVNGTTLVRRSELEKWKDERVARAAILTGSTRRRPKPETGR